MGGINQAAAEQAASSSSAPAPNTASSSAVLRHRTGLGWMFYAQRHTNYPLKTHNSLKTNLVGSWWFVNPVRNQFSSLASFKHQLHSNSSWPVGHNLGTRLGDTPHGQANRTPQIGYVLLYPMLLNYMFMKWICYQNHVQKYIYISIHDAVNPNAINLKLGDGYLPPIGNNWDGLWHWLYHIISHDIPISSLM